jgi:hypothetical protein
MKTMKTLKQNLLKSLLFIFVSALAFLSNARSAFDGITPVAPASFTAMLNDNNRVELNWTTGSEDNLSYFMVEKSTDGKNFSDAALVFAYEKTNSESSYSFNDNISKIKSGVVYYRLRLVDADGSIRNTDTRVIIINKPGNNDKLISARLDPASNELSVTIPVKWQNKKVVYELFSTNGQPAGRTITPNSHKTETLHINDLKPGFYILSVSCNGGIAQQKIIR